MVVVATVGRTLLLVWDVSAVQEEPWRRLLQELSSARREEEYMESRRRLGVSAESVWLLAKPSGGGVAVVYLEAEDPERALGELAASEAPFRLMVQRSNAQAFRLRFGAVTTGSRLRASFRMARWWSGRA